MCADCTESTKIAKSQRRIALGTGIVASCRDIIIPILTHTISTRQLPILSRITGGTFIIVSQTSLTSGKAVGTVIVGTIGLECHRTFNTI